MERISGKGITTIKSEAGRKLFRLIFILFSDEILGILPPWQMEVFLNDGLPIERAPYFICGSSHSRVYSTFQSLQAHRQCCAI
jgi:hypothetical protein